MITENEQYESKESFYHLEICCRHAAEKYGKPIISEWINGDYIKLSGKLSRHTEVYISASTLKRIFGKLKTSGRYYPQKATRDALANYTGFTDWETFIQKHPRPAKHEEGKLNPSVNSPIEPSFPKNSNNSRKLIRWLLLIILLVACGIVFWQLQKKDKEVILQSGEAKLICNNPEGESPHSAVFKLQLQAGFSASTEKFTIDFGDGHFERKILPGFLVTHYYEVPGRYYAVLKYNSLGLDTIPIYLKTNGWSATATIQHDTTRVYPINGILFKSGNILVTPNELLHAGVDTNRTFFVHFANTKPLAISGDDFELSTKVTTSLPRPGIRCSQVNITLYGEKSDHVVVIIKPGCVSWAYLRFSEIFKDGEREDLGSLGTDLTKGGKIKLQVINKKVKIWVNDKMVHQNKYEIPLGKLYGIKFTFAGIGMINEFYLTDLKSGKLFFDGFKNP